MHDSIYLGHSLTERVGEFIRLRRDIHAQPELAFEEHQTSALVASKLKAWGYEVETGLGRTGVVGTLRRGRGQRSLGLRADMDALPIAEASGLPWASQRAGLMHACGHDGHTATLLAAARLIAEDVSFDGVLHLIFQPAEEGAGGAVQMMADGLFERFPCDAVFALHNMPGIESGRFVFRSGPTMASSDNVTITLKGMGGHGAFPHQTRDTLVAASSLVMALQTVVSRNVDPLKTAVVTVGALHSGQANNVIPDDAQLELSIRTLDDDVRKLVRRRIHDLVQLQAQSYGVEASIDWREGYAVLVNSPAETALAVAVATDLLGPERVDANGPMFTASEDFAFMLQKVPGCYLFVGNGGPGTPGACAVHNPGYDFNDDIIAPGAAFWCRLVQTYFQSGAVIG
ncbi:M20 family metallopeptidase [Curvibacter sp. HBC28]|uniref:M20 family metallopeptidase n=1 Tax=Curvibacter microcysteis TaxID=3026419 RepID=A0ABT5M9E3_9BURK|nr:M20 aminoacylase family protein [Curvibacter sp. HBC28]MDD0813215.1 M20 family metallopeptidase [Curvibacter sp. HBC28]